MGGQALDWIFIGRILFYQHGTRSLQYVQVYVHRLKRCFDENLWFLGLYFSSKLPLRIILSWVYFKKNGLASRWRSSVFSISKSKQFFQWTFPLKFYKNRRHLWDGEDLGQSEPNKPTFQSRWKMQYLLESASGNIVF